VTTNNEQQDEITGYDCIIRSPKRAPQPVIPTVEEYDEHQLTHTPLKASCPICVRDQGKNFGHFRQRNVRSIPIFHMDYMYITSDYSVNDISNPILVIKERHSGAIWAFMQEHKGATPSRIIERVSNENNRASK